MGERHAYDYLWFTQHSLNQYANGTSVDTDTEHVSPQIVILSHFITTRGLFLNSLKTTDTIIYLINIQEYLEYALPEGNLHFFQDGIVFDLMLILRHLKSITELITI